MSARTALAGVALAALLAALVLLIATIGPFPVFAGIALFGTIGALLQERLAPDAPTDEEESA
jgi:hypothetical protein